MSTTTDLAARYGTPSRWARRAVIAASTALGVAFVAFVLWAATSHATPDVESSLFSFDAVDEHTVVVQVDIDLAEGVEADCLVRAQSVDKAVVGELNFAPLDGRQEVTVRTDRLATAVEMVGCRTPDQARRR